MTAWTWVALALILSGWTVAFVLDRRGSERSLDAKVASGVVTRRVIAAVLAWVNVRLVGSRDVLHLFLALVVGLVALASFAVAVLGIMGLVSRSSKA